MSEALVFSLHGGVLFVRPSYCVCLVVVVICKDCCIVLLVLRLLSVEVMDAFELIVRQWLGVMNEGSEVVLLSTN